MKNTRSNIMAATRKLIVEKGYSDMTTKDVAKEAQVNEVTLFRQFGSKKELLLTTLKEAEWILTSDLRLMMEAYLTQVTPEIVRFSLGLRAQEICHETMPYIEKIPTAFIQTLEDYLSRMKSKKQVKIHDPKKSAEIIFSSMIGFAFLHAYSSSDQYEKEVEIFISHAIDQFINGLI